MEGSESIASPTSATIGVFDGLHLGHRALVARVVGKAPGMVPSAFTFNDNPKKVTRPNRFSGCLFSIDQKLAALDEAGIQLCVLIDFSGNFSKLAGSEFVSTLVRSFGVRSFVVGSDFKCGHRLSTDAASLKAIAGSLGAEAEIIPPVIVEGETVSSSRIRSAIADGRTDLALAMLGRPYTLDLRRIGLGYDGVSAAVSLRGRGVVEPAPGTYEATVICRTGRRDVEATLRLDGTLRWPREECAFDAEPAFLAFGPKIA
jgi:riboflavin kinase/FMN adenylyltransferase